MCKSRKRFLCMDCKTDTGKAGEHYMLKDSVWLAVVKDNKGMLCIGCIERRLGRQLSALDFNDSYINKPGGFAPFMSMRLLARLQT